MENGTDLPRLGVTVGSSRLRNPCDFRRSRMLLSARSDQELLLVQGCSEEGMRIPPGAAELLAGLYLVWPSDGLASSQSPGVSLALY